MRLYHPIATRPCPGVSVTCADARPLQIVLLHHNQLGSRVVDRITRMMHHTPRLIKVPRDPSPRVQRPSVITAARR